MSHYDTLGVSRDAPPEEIKKAYRKLSMEHHPDKGGDEEQFKKVSEAYATLSDAGKRQEYDNPSPFGGMGGNMGGGFPGGFPFGFERPRPRKPDLNAPRDGQFIGVEAELPLKNFVFGGEFKVKLSFHEGCEDCGGKGFSDGKPCDECRGEGYVQQVERRPGFVSSAMRPCPRCQGLGQVATDRCETCKGGGNHEVRDKEFTFHIPRGAGIGSKIISNGTGRVGLNGGRNGDVGIMISNVKPAQLNKLTPKQVEELNNLLEVLDNATKSA